MSFLKNRTVVGVICILLSLLICFGLTPLFNQSVSQKAEIVRVVQPIRAGDEITESMVQIVEVGGYNLPEDVLRQKESAVGKYATADLAVGDYIIPSKLSDAPAAENAYLYSLDGSQQAISVSIKSFAEGLSGKLQSGDIVSVIAPDYKQQGQTVVPAELQYVEIISVTASSGYDANTGEPVDEEDDKELPDTVTLLVSPEQAKVLAELEAEGTIHLALVYRGDRENADKFLTSQDEIILELYPPEPDPEEKPQENPAEPESDSAADIDTEETQNTAVQQNVHISVSKFVIGGILGAVLACIFVLLKYLFSGSLRSEEEIKTLYHSNILGTIRSSMKGKHNKIDRWYAGARYGKAGKLSLETEI